MGSLRRSHHAWLLKVVLVLGLFASAGIAVGVVSGADQPSISSDQQDYAPSSTVELSGEGWQAGEALELVVDDDQDDVWTYETELTADEDGTVSDSFDLPDLAGAFTVTATAPSGTASASFTVTAPAEPEPEPNPPCVATGTETLASDKPSYLPGGRVVLRGSGYAPSCDLVLRITLPDASVLTETVTTDAVGDLGHEYALPSPAVPGEYLAETVGAGDAVLASATFEGVEPTTGTPAIWTDRDDYKPGETFELRGAGWLPGEAIQVVVDDDDGDTWLHTADVVAGVDGTFMHLFQLPDWFVAVYTVTATGGSSGAATTSFTDAVAFGGCTTSGGPPHTLVVNTATDEFNTTANATCSLREAIRAANQDSTGVDTIVLSNATYTLTITGTGNDTTSTGDLDVLQPVTITGNGAIIQAHTTSGSGIDRVFHVLSGSLAITNATVRHGRVGSGGGGGVLTSGGSLTLSNATLTSNQTTGGNDGAGIHSAGGTVVVDDSTISGNSAGTNTSAEGGGLYASGGSWTFTDSTINGNSASGNAAGIWTSGTGTLTNVTLTENTSSGIAGGIRVDSSTTTITNATISHNTAGSGTGGGVARTSGTVSLRNTIVANNVVGVNAHANCSTTDASQLVNSANNLDSGVTCLFVALNGSQSGANPGLGALAANGGPTMTRSIGSTSPAVDKGTAASAPANDQRGLGRTDGPDVDLIAQHDVGAYEFQAPVNTAPTVAYVSPPTSANESETKIFNFAITDPDAADTFTFVTGFPSCGTGGALVGAPAIDNPTKTGSFQCLFADGPASPDVQVRVKDAANLESNTASQPVTVANVAPSIVISGAAGVNEGSVYTLTLGALTDPGPDTVTQYIVHWGDGTDDAYTTAGSKTHTYADGTATRSVTVDLVDEDGTHLNRGNPLSVQVDNVVPTIAISGDAGVAEGATYSLTLGSVTDPGTDTVSSYVVHWGDGSTDAYGSNGVKTHTYADGPNTYSVTVDLVDEDGTHLNRANAHSVAVTNIAPAVTAPAAQTADEGTSQTFDLGSFTDPGDDDPWQVTVDWGDGSSDTIFTELSAGAIADQAHVYADNGSYTVTVTVAEEGGSGANGSATFAVTVANVAPEISAPANQTSDEGTSTLFSLGSFTDPGDDDPWQVTVDWGDGSSDSSFDETAPGTIAATAHTYADDGTFTVTVTVAEENGSGANDDASFQVTVANVPPNVTAPAGQTATEGSSTSFALGSFTDPGDDDPWEATVDWGDGSSDTTFDAAAPGAIAAQAHAYADNGVYTVTVSVREDDGAGATGSATFQVTVANVTPQVTPPANQTADEASSQTFDLGSFTDPGDDDPWEVTVDWGDGSSDSVFDEPSGGAITDTTHTYPDNAVYTVTITVTEDDGAGAAGSATFTVTVANLPPEISNVGAETPIDEGDSSTVTVTASDPAGANDPLSYEFDCNDDGTFEVGPQAGASHACSFGDNGTFDVNVRVSDGDGGSDAATTSIVVLNVDPTITNVTSVSPIDEGDSSLITVSATDPAGPNDPLSYEFDCTGDATFEVAPQASSSHACSFDDNGSFTVNVRVSDGDGGSVTSSTTVVVNNVEPTIEISGAANVDEGSSYSLTLGAVTDPGDDTVTTWVVHWGDGLSDTYTSDGVKTHTYADGPDDHDITVDLTDEDGTYADRANALSVHVSNVDPTIAISGAASVAEGSSYALTLGAVNDPGADAVSSYVVHWGDGTSTPYTSIGDTTHVYADGPNSYAVMVDLVDEDGTYLDAANDHSVSATNVSPSIAISGAASVDEGAPYGLTLGAVTDPGADTVAEYVVHWGDGSSDSYAAAGVKTHTYADGLANHAITVDLEDEDGTFPDRANDLSVQVDNIAPAVSAPANQPASEGTGASFSLGSFTDPGDDDPWEVMVDWGDGSADTVFTVAAPGAIAATMHTYADDGTFTVTVTVDEDNGSGTSGSATFQAIVANVAPSVTSQADDTASEGTSKTFELGSFTDPGDDDPWEVTVDWGDGSADTVFTAASTGAIADKAHTYADDGTFTVTLTVEEDNGAGVGGSATFQVAVANVAPEVAAPSDQAANEGTAKTFDLGSFTDPGADSPWKVTVSWGDATANTVFTQSSAGAITDQPHTYADDGAYTVSITVAEENGAGPGSHTATFQIAVANVAPTVLKPYFEQTLVGCQTNVTLKGINFSDPGVNDKPWTVDIDWGDSSLHTVVPTNTQGAQPDQTHTYLTSGTFTATVKVTDNDGNFGTNTSSNTATVYQYTVAFRPPVEGSTATRVVENRMKNGRVVPVKVTIRDLCAGTDLTNPSSTVKIQVTKYSGTPGVDDPITEYADAGNSSDGTNLFRWSGDHWIYNLDSKALGFVVGNKYRVDVFVGAAKATIATWAVLEPVK